MSTGGRFGGKRKARNGHKSFSRRRKAPAFGKSNNRTGGFLGIETKFYDTSLDQAALDTNVGGEDGEHDQSATIGPSTITQGDGESQRDGRRCAILSWNVTGMIAVAKQIDQTAPDTGNLIFIALVLDSQTNGALLNSEDVYLNPSGGVSSGCSLLRNLQFTKRFRVLGTRKFHMDTPNFAYDGTNLEQGGHHRAFNIFVRFKTPLICTYSGTTETIANSVDNSLHILAWTTGTGLSPSMSYNSRVRFRG